jgi:hypothetical protein
MGKHELSGTPLLVAITALSSLAFFLMGYDNGMSMHRLAADREV